MEESPSPLQPLLFGSKFVLHQILSFYGYAHQSACLLHRLCTRTRQTLWEIPNGLNAFWRDSQKVVTINSLDLKRCMPWIRTRPRGFFKVRVRISQNKMDDLSQLSKIEQEMWYGIFISVDLESSETQNQIPKYILDAIDRHTSRGITFEIGIQKNMLVEKRFFNAVRSVQGDNWEAQGLAIWWSLDREFFKIEKLDELSSTQYKHLSIKWVHIIDYLTDDQLRFTSKVLKNLECESLELQYCEKSNSKLEEKFK